MLVLSRKTNQTIRIGDDVSLRVVAIEGGSVKIGIEAPPTVPVHRGEVYERIQRENRNAARETSVNLGSVAHALRKDKEG